jgi:putative glutamine amidotransferase
MKRPVIGITTTLEEQSRRHELWRAYPNAVEKAGGVPVFLPADDKYPHYEEYLSLVDGLLLSGGQDILPTFYGQEPWAGLKETWPMCPSRDRFEIKIARLAVEREKPVLGLCRGLQLLNVAFGGDLWQDVSLLGTDPLRRVAHFQNLGPGWPCHKARLSEGRLKGIFRGDFLMVNSLHHQAARWIPEELQATAIAEDGVVEALERQGPLFVVGVQWHPELLIRSDPRQLDLFQAFVEAAGHARSR